MDIQPVTLESWPTMQVPREEVKATLQYVAHKAKKPVSFRWYTEGEGYSPQSVSVRVLVHDGIQATYSVRQVKIGDQTHPLAPEQKAAAMAFVHKEWKPIRDELNQILGLVDHNRIIIPIEITAADNDAARAILAYVVEQAIPLLDFDVDDILREKEEEFAQHFTSAFHASVRTRLELRKEELSQKQREAEQAYYTILDFERDKPVLEEEIALLSKLAQRDRSALARSQAKALTQLQTTGEFSHIALDDQGVLRATTAPITIEHDGYEFPVGRYEIQIPSSGDVRIKALDEHPNSDHPHPHVARDNRPCLGNISGDLAKLIGRMRYAEALQLISKFLSSYNSENPYEKIGHFDPSGEYQDEDDDPPPPGPMC